MLKGEKRARALATVMWPGCSARVSLDVCCFSYDRDGSLQSFHRIIGPIVFVFSQNAFELSRAMSGCKEAGEELEALWSEHLTQAAGDSERGDRPLVSGVWTRWCWCSSVN